METRSRGLTILREKDKNIVSRHNSSLDAVPSDD